MRSASGFKIKLLAVFVLIIISNYEIDACVNEETCDDCLKHIDCAWCLIEDANSGVHCFNKTVINEHCEHNKIINPEPIEVVSSNKGIQTSSADLNQIVQIQPQSMSLKLRKDEEHTVDFRYGQSADFPVDLYYIMDLSASLKPDKENLANVGRLLVQTMQKVTRNFQIGFGSFVDKTDAPFISTRPDKIKQPCQGCVPAYSFKNHLSLTTNGVNFAQEVRKAAISGNLDVPEGGFDALMQAMVCHEEIGWRSFSTRIIVFTTDAAFHVAGDGKLAGIVIPNDGTCHMQNHEYSAALKYDYPSISHINYVAKQNNVHILFVVKDKVEHVYKSLEKFIDNSKAVGLKDTEIIKEIENFYMNISESVKFAAPQSQNVHVSFSSTCKDDESFTKNIECTGVTAGRVLDFKVKIKPTKCIDGEEIINIRPNTQDTKLEIKLRTTCACENCGPDAINAPSCNRHGNLHCGVCECASGFNGKECECDQSKNEDFEKDDKCKAGNETEICSGRGSCRCNVCNCDRRENGQVISGKYCECDNFSCPKSGHLICNNNGDCVCGRCRCHPDWSGDACECKNDFTTCAYDEKVCNGHGACKCGKCVCEKHYFGQYCEECTTCYGGKCDELKPCVECKLYNKGKYKDDCDIKCTQYTINAVDTIDDDDVDDSKVCRYIEENCKLVFTYKYENDKIVAYALKELLCSEPINVIALVFGIIAAILVIGIIALISWKLWTNYKDKIEYAKFEEERDRAKWEIGDNPLFRSPVTTFQNPTYGKRASSMFKRRTRS